MSIDAEISFHVPQRECGDCTRCCEGWLHADIYGKLMYPGNPCFFLNKGNGGCSIYPDRPEHPCKTYYCAWREEQEIFPAWLRPSLSNVIITHRKIGEELDFYDVEETGVKIDSSVLNWIMQWALKNKVNLSYSIEGRKHYIGSAEFYQKVTSPNLVGVESLKKK